MSIFSKKNTLLYLTVFTILACTGATWTYATRKKTNQEPYKGAYYYTPRSTRIKFQTQKIHIQQAGVSVPYSIIHTPYFDMRVPEPDEWALITESSTSLSFRHKSIKNTQLSFTLHTNRRTFLPSVEKNSIQGYVEGLKRKHWGSIEILNEGNYTGSGPHSFKTIISQPFSFVHYKIKDKRNRSSYWLHLDYFFEIHKEIMAVSFVCPEAHSKEGIKSLDYYIKRLILLRNQDKQKKFSKSKRLVAFHCKEGFTPTL